MLVFNYCSRNKNCQRRWFVADRAVDVRLDRPVNHTCGVACISIVGWIYVVSIMASAIRTNVYATVEGYTVVESESVAVADMI